MAFSVNDDPPGTPSRRVWRWGVRGSRGASGGRDWRLARPDPDEVPRHLCLDKGFDTPAAEAVVIEAGYEPHIRRIGEEAKPCEPAKGHKPRRWVVGRIISWLNR